MGQELARGDLDQLALGRGLAPALVEDRSFAAHEAGVQRDGPDEVGLDLEGGVGDPCRTRGLHRAAHGAVQQRGGKAAVDDPDRVVAGALGHGGGHADTSAGTGTGRRVVRQPPTAALSGTSQIAPSSVQQRTMSRMARMPVISPASTTMRWRKAPRTIAAAASSSDQSGAANTSP